MDSYAQFVGAPTSRWFWTADAWLSIFEPQVGGISHELPAVAPSFENQWRRSNQTGCMAFGIQVWKCGPFGLLGWVERLIPQYLGPSYCSALCLLPLLKPEIRSGDWSSVKDSLNLQFFDRRDV